MSAHCLTHRFVETVPEHLEQDVIYVSFEFATVIHLCCCGCGGEVVTPLSPNDWKLTFNGESIALHPSIGNWSFPCRSHYWIRRNCVEWAPLWTDEEVRHGRKSNCTRKDPPKSTATRHDSNNQESRSEVAITTAQTRSLLERVLRWFR